MEQNGDRSKSKVRFLLEEAVVSRLLKKKLVKKKEIID